MIDTLLSTHFRLSEFLRSETAARSGIDNTPPAEAIERLRNTAQGLEEVRELLGVALHISSGYRCLELNRAIGSKDTSAHVRGDATDFEAPAYGTPLEICRALERSEIEFDQLIWEHTWVHLGWAKQGEVARRQVLTMMPGGTYASGIVEQVTM